MSRALEGEEEEAERGCEEDMTANLGDERWNRRVGMLLRCLAGRPEGSTPSTFQSWKTAKLELRGRWTAVALRTHWRLQACFPEAGPRATCLGQSILIAPGSTREGAKSWRSSTAAC